VASQPFSATLKGGEGLKVALAQMVGESGTLRAGLLEGATYPDGTPVAAVAAFNEFGTLHTPARPFMRSTVQKDGKRWAKGFARLIKGQQFKYMKALNLLGEQVVGDIKVSVSTWSDPKNSPATEKAKGFNKPLVDTGHLQRSIAYEVTK
jgi:hypothetical protein